MGIVGVGAGELIAEGVLAMEMAALASDLKMTIHPHPDLVGNRDGSGGGFLRAEYPSLSAEKEKIVCGYP